MSLSSYFRYSGASEPVIGAITLDLSCILRKKLLLLEQFHLLVVRCYMWMLWQLGANTVNVYSQMVNNVGFRHIKSSYLWYYLRYLHVNFGSKMYLATWMVNVHFHVLCSWKNIKLLLTSYVLFFTFPMEATFYKAVFYTDKWSIDI